MGALILVHGLAHGAWCWSRTRADLVARGHDVLAVDLPLTGLDEDAAALRRALDDWGRESVLVGHSYAGLVISRAAAERPDVQHLVYVAAMLVDGGDVYLDFQRWMSTRAGEVVTLDTDHSPFMSSPGQFADLLAGIVDDTKQGVARPTC